MTKKTHEALADYMGKKVENPAALPYVFPGAVVDADASELINQADSEPPFTQGSSAHRRRRPGTPADDSGSDDSDTSADNASSSSSDSSDSD